MGLCTSIPVILRAPEPAPRTERQIVPLAPTEQVVEPEVMEGMVKVMMKPEPASEVASEPEPEPEPEPASEVASEPASEPEPEPVLSPQRPLSSIQEETVEVSPVRPISAIENYKYSVGLIFKST